MSAPQPAVGQNAAYALAAAAGGAWALAAPPRAWWPLLPLVDGVARYVRRCRG